MQFWTISGRHARTLGRGRAVVAALVAAPLLAGCVNQREYDDLYTTNRGLEERNVALQQELETRDATISALRQRVSTADTTVDQMRRQNLELQGNVDRIMTDVQAIDSRLGTVALAVVDPATDRALRDLAQRNSSIITYDPALGMVRFASDMTFGSGSAEVQPAAATALQQLAQVLASSRVTSYDIRVVGHTDNVPIGNPATRQRHPSNMHLSVHRAISVRDVLRQAGVPSERMQVAGWGEFRPAVPNPPSGGAAANRRVELFIIPSSGAGRAPSGSDEVGTPPQADQPMK